MAKLKCCGCKERFDRETMISQPAGKFHSYDCATIYAKSKADKARNARINLEKRKDAQEHRKAKESIKKRTGKGGHYEPLKTALHYYVKHVLRKGEPCYTCGLEQKPTDSPQSFHAGHFIPAGSVDPRRFMLENLRMQCYSCNVPNSGMRAEYRQRLIEEMGQEHVDWLECDANFKSLKEQYPDVEDIKKEAARYRALAIN